MRERIIAGCMTGTSLDGIDAALVAVRGEGLGMAVRMIAGVSGELGECAAALRALAEGRAVTAEAGAAAARDLALRHVEVVQELMTSAGVWAELACVHGQTVLHKPPVSWQVMNGAVVAAGLRMPVVFDLRAADLAAGGEGAPITPIADWVWLRSAEETRVVVNLGGFANATVLLKGGGVETVRAGDLCACNQVLNEVARLGLGCAFDADGAAAQRGTVDEGARAELEAVLRKQGSAGRSLGTGDEAAAWVARWRGRLRGEDLAATAAAGVGGAIAEGVRRMVREAGTGDERVRVLLAGGGRKNAALVRALAGAWQRGSVGSGAKAVQVGETDDAGLAGTYREAAEFAVLGALCADGVAITLPGVTGCGTPAPVAGVWAGLEYAEGVGGVRRGRR